MTQTIAAQKEDTRAELLLRNNPTIAAAKANLQAAVSSLRGKLASLDVDIQTIEASQSTIEQECVRLGFRNDIGAQIAAESPAPSGSSARSVHMASQLVRWIDP